MTLTLRVDDAGSSGGSLEGGLIGQPDRPKLPIRCPRHRRLGWIGSTGRSDRLHGHRPAAAALDPAAALPVLGAVVRLRVDWDRQLLIGRLAAHGVAGRFLVSIGERAIRNSPRFAVSRTATAHSMHLYGPVEVRITDLSTGGARVEGVDLPVGSDVSLTFTPPGGRRRSA